MADDGLLPLKYNLVALILTYRCPIACPMCFLQCGPRRKEVMERRLALDALNQAAAMGISFVGLTGGEPLLEKQLLADVAARAAELRLKAILVTNAYWAVSLESARIRLAGLRDAGVARIQVSLDDQHQRWIRMENVAFAVRAAMELGFEDVKLLGSSKGNSESFKYQLFCLQELLGVDVSTTDPVDRPRVSHAAFQDGDQRVYSFDELSQNEQLRPGECLSELMIDIDGTVYPCCNNFIGAIGNIRREPLDEIVRRTAQHPFVRRIWDSGPTGLARHLDANYGRSFCSGQYESWCGLCSRIFRDPAFVGSLAGRAANCGCPEVAPERPAGRQIVAVRRSA